MVTGATTRRVVKLEEQGSESAHVAFNFEDIRQKCDEFIEQTRAKAAQMLVQAHEDAEKVKAAAMQQGLKDGEKQGLAASEQKIKAQADKIAEQKLATSLATLKPALEQAADQMRIELHSMMTVWESQMVQLAAQLALRITRRQIEVDPTIVVEMVRDVIQATVGEDRVHVQLHPEDATLVSTHLNLDSLSKSGQLPVMISATDGFTRGDCVVTTSHGQIDARIEAMLDQLARELAGE